MGHASRLNQTPCQHPCTSASAKPDSLELLARRMGGAPLTCPQRRHASDTELVFASYAIVTKVSRARSASYAAAQMTVQATAHVIQRTREHASAV